MELKYGCNPHQAFAAGEALPGGRLPVELRNGNPSLINLLDALNAWQLVREARAALGLPAAASFKHVSPAGAALATRLPPDLAHAYEVEGLMLTRAALAYVRARGADPKCSFGDFVALSDPVDLETARFLKGVVSDGIVAPGYEAGAFEILAAKKGGGFVVLEADPEFEPPEREVREVFGMRLIQDRNQRAIGLADVENVVCGDESVVPVESTSDADAEESWVTVDSVCAAPPPRCCGGEPPLPPPAQSHRALVSQEGDTSVVEPVAEIPAELEQVPNAEPGFWQVTARFGGDPIGESPLVAFPRP